VSFIAFVPSGIAVLRAQKATFRVLAEGDPDVDAALASAVGCSPPPRSLTPAAATALRPEGPSCARLRRRPDCPTAVALSGGRRIHVVARSDIEQQRGRRPAATRDRIASPRPGSSFAGSNPKRRAHSVAVVVAGRGTAALVGSAPGRILGSGRARQRAVISRPVPAPVRADSNRIRSRRREPCCSSVVVWHQPRSGG